MSDQWATMVDSAQPSGRALDLAAQTWDGEPVSATLPFGATIVVTWKRANEVRYLILHRAHQGPDFAGDWAWGPPSGARHPDEPIEQCAARELFEETGLQLPITLTSAGSADWVVYQASVDVEPEICLSAEHDRFDWLPLSEATRLVKPGVVRDQLLMAAGIRNFVGAVPCAGLRARGPQATTSVANREIADWQQRLSISDRWAGTGHRPYEAIVRRDRNNEQTICERPDILTIIYICATMPA